MVKKIWEFYQYLFYKYYRWSVWLNRGMDPYSYQAGWAFLSLLLFANFLTILCITEIVTGYGFDQFSKLPKIFIIATMTVFLFINYFIFIKNRKYKKIIERYEKEDRKSKIKGNIIAWLCIIITALLVVSSAFLLYKSKPKLINRAHHISLYVDQRTLFSQEEQLINSREPLLDFNNS